jgi:hypothetical protein
MQDPVRCRLLQAAVRNDIGQRHAGVAGLGNEHENADGAVDALGPFGIRGPWGARAH